MKIAVVLSGYFGTISTNDMQSGINSHKKITNFFKDYDVDYYIHSWQTEDKDKIIDLYKIYCLCLHYLNLIREFPFFVFF